MTLTLGMQHKGPKPHENLTNDDPKLTLVFKARSDSILNANR